MFFLLEGWGKAVDSCCMVRLGVGYPNAAATWLLLTGL
jgi:hypothetical protein